CSHKITGLQQCGNRIASAARVVKFINKSSLLILSLREDFLGRSCCSITNKRFIVIASAPLAANRCKRHFHCGYAELLVELPVVSGLENKLINSFRFLFITFLYSIVIALTKLFFHLYQKQIRSL